MYYVSKTHLNIKNISIKQKANQKKQTKNPVLNEQPQLKQ